MSPNTQPLKPNESKTLSVSAREQWNSSHILFEKDIEYGLEIIKVHRWDDNGIKNIEPMEGFTRWYLPPFLRRYPAADWFVLVGAVGRTRKHFFVINQKPLLYTPKVTGEFFCFANDSWFAYGNNVGSLELKITRH